MKAVFLLLSTAAFVAASASVACFGCECLADIVGQIDAITGFEIERTPKEIGTLGIVYVLCAIAIALSSVNAGIILAIVIKRMLTRDEGRD